MKSLEILLKEQFGPFVELGEIDSHLNLSVNPVGLHFKEAGFIPFKEIKKDSVKAVCVRPYCYSLKEFVCILHTMAYKHDEKCVFLLKINTSVYVAIYKKIKHNRIIDILKVKEVLSRIEEKKLDLTKSLVFLKGYSNKK